MLDFEKTNQALFDFLNRSPVPFYAVRNMKEVLDRAGFAELCEGDWWTLEPGASYYVSRNDSALIAFRLPREKAIGFQIMASHCDSPVFKIKANAEITVENRYVRLNVEKYGGMLCAPWLDRPLSVAGRIVLETEDPAGPGTAAGSGNSAGSGTAAGSENCTGSGTAAGSGTTPGPGSLSAGIETRLVNVDRDLLIIPNLAIHMNRGANDGFPYNAQTDLLPLFAQAPEPGGDRDTSGLFLSLIAKEAGVCPDRILDADLYLYNRMPAAYIGQDREFIASGRLDDLQCAFASLQGILNARPSRSVAVHCVYDNEEVGSGTRQGAGSTFLRDVLHRISAALGNTEEDYLRALTSSFMVSADNAHSVHPNHPEKADPTNRPCMNKGIVIKYSANQKYTTDAVSGAIFRQICRRADVPFQTFANRSDMIGGSTLGNISQAHVAVPTVDVGLAQLAMHSPFETAGAKDTAYLAEAARILFSGSVEGRGDGTYRLYFS